MAKLLKGERSGISHICQYRLHTSFYTASSGQPIAANLELVDTDGYAGLGAIVTQSSGIFSFPVTGIWLITFQGEFYYNGNSRFNTIRINTSVNAGSGDTYDMASAAHAFVIQTESSDTYNSAFCNFSFGVTSTTTHKCQFVTDCSSLNNVTIAGNSTWNRTSFTFMRMGDI